MNKLLSYLPPFLREYKELQGITDSEYPEIEYVNNGIRLVLSNQFIKTLSAEGCERWENILHITPHPDDSLKTRRLKILEKFQSALPYTERTFQAKLDAMYGEGNAIMSIDYNNYAVTIDIVAPLIFNANELRKMARVIIPANMCLFISNTKKAKVPIYAGGLVKPFAEFKILPSDNFTGAVLGAGQYQGGIIKYYRKMVI